jgi:hypothetical protein
MVACSYYWQFTALNNDVATNSSHMSSLLDRARSFSVVRAAGQMHE